MTITTRYLPVHSKITLCLLILQRKETINLYYLDLKNFIEWYTYNQDSFIYSTCDEFLDTKLNANYFFHFQIMYRYNMLPVVSDFHRGACSCSILWWVHLHRKQEITTYKYRYMYWLLRFRSVTGIHFVNSLWVICLDIDFIIVNVLLLFIIINRFD